MIVAATDKLCTTTIVANILGWAIIGKSLFFNSKEHQQKKIHKVKSRLTLDSWGGFHFLPHIVSLFFELFLHVSKCQYFFPIWIPIVLIYLIWKTSRNKLKKHFVTKTFSDLVLVWINCFSVLKHFVNYWPSALNFKSFARPERFFSHSMSDQFR